MFSIAKKTIQNFYYQSSITAEPQGWTLLLSRHGSYALHLSGNVPDGTAPSPAYEGHALATFLT